MKPLKWLAMCLALLLSIAPLFVFSHSAQAQDCDPTQDYLAIGQAAFDVQNYEGALAAYNCAVQLQPNSPQAYNRRGWTHYQLKQFRSAYDDFTQAIVIDPDYAYAYNNRGLVLYYWGQNAEALADFDRAIELGYSVAEQNRGLVAGANTTTTSTNNSTTALVPTATPVAGATQAVTTGATPTQAVVVQPTSTPEFTQEEYFQMGNDAYRLGDYEAATSYFSLSGQRDSYMYMVIGAYDYAILYVDSSCHSHYCGLIRAYSNFQLGNEEEARNEYIGLIQNSYYDWIAYPYLMDMYKRFEDTPEESASIDTWLALFDVVEDHDPIGIGDTVTVEMQDMYVFTIPFEGEAGQVVDIQAIDGSSDVVDALLVVADPDGEFLAFNEDSDLGFDSFIPELELPSDGTYTLYVTHAGGGSYGPVEVIIRETSAQ